MFRIGNKIEFDLAHVGQGKPAEPLHGEIELSGHQLLIRFKHYGEEAADHGAGEIVWLEFYDRKLLLHYAPDITADEVKTVDLEGAHESLRGNTDDS